MSPSLKEILPHDYINYTKVACVDSSGIEHPIYPTSKTSNPQFKGNIVGSHDEAHLNVEPSDWTLGVDGDGDSFVWSDDYEYGGSITGGTVSNSGVTQTSIAIGTQIKIPLPDLKNGKPYQVRFDTSILQYNAVDKGGVNVGARGKFKVMLFGEKGQRWTAGYDAANSILHNPYVVGGGSATADFRTSPIDKQYQKLATTHADYDNEKCLIIEVVDEVWVGVLSKVIVTERTDGRTSPTYQNNNLTGGPDNSKTWNNYKSQTPSTNNSDDYEDDTYWPLEGMRYGLDPQHAQANGSYYIDPHTNFIHFSSNLSGKTVILKYLTDRLSSNSEAIVHKFAEEAMYKHIMYAILSTRTNVPARQLIMLKKERFAAIRQAKLRLSNIKLQEISQVLRGKSKQIKH